MAKQVWRYDIGTGDHAIDMPIGAVIVHFAFNPSRGRPCLWALVNPEVQKEKRLFRLYQTGEDIENLESKKHIGTFFTHEGMFVYHLFEIL